MRRSLAFTAILAAPILGTLALADAAVLHRTPTSARASGHPQEDAVLLGRSLVINHDCNGCHGGIDPSSPEWLSGARTQADEFPIGACGTERGAQPGAQPGAQACFHTRPRNLTPDNATGTGRFTERQIFNALRYGLRPEDTPDIEITSTTPGQGNFPAHPHYLAPPMPWPGFRHMSDRELMAIAAYLKHGVKPVTNRVPESEGPPDFWASAYTPDKIGVYPSPPFPAASEQARP